MKGLIFKYPTYSDKVQRYPRSALDCKPEGELRWEERFTFAFDIVTIPFNPSPDLYLNLHCPELVTVPLQGNFH